MLSQSERGRKSSGRREMERDGEVAGGRGQRWRERDGGKERAMDGWKEGGREKERINSSGALVPHYPGRALSPWQCGRKRIAQA